MGSKGAGANPMVDYAPNPIQKTGQGGFGQAIQTLGTIPNLMSGNPGPMNAAPTAATLAEAEAIRGGDYRVGNHRPVMMQIQQTQQMQPTPQMPPMPQQPMPQQVWQQQPQQDPNFMRQQEILSRAFRLRR